jgi:hypothetical protein
MSQMARQDQNFSKRTDMFKNEISASKETPRFHEKKWQFIDQHFETVWYRVF